VASEAEIIYYLFAEEVAKKEYFYPEYSEFFD
jgi:hypothetical protein